MSSPATEFDCAECGVHVIAFGLEEPPPHRRCATCDWIIREVPDEKEREIVRAFLARLRD